MYVLYHYFDRCFVLAIIRFLFRVANYPFLTSILRFCLNNLTTVLPTRRKEGTKMSTYGKEIDTKGATVGLR